MLRHCSKDVTMINIEENVISQSRRTGDSQASGFTGKLLCHEAGTLKSVPALLAQLPVVAQWLRNFWLIYFELPDTLRFVNSPGVDTGPEGHVVCPHDA